MKYTVEIEINKPIDEVVKLFDNEDNLFKWMRGLQSIEHLSGEPGKNGSTSKMIFKQGKREIEMLETVISLNLPDEFIASYEAKGVYNLAKISFLPMGDNKTKYVTEQEFQLKGFMKVVGLIMPGAFKKQTASYLKMFKDFAEDQ
ncbi:SRPBCC family protein [Marinifilum caeruleilacunae]|uniref:SRPBCC family protein n=1 Tax=Marinifilum caeruleilacunae TaxID=2499076 RepID=A0ABX1WXX8_9BACT|nr:SRPBCC family protein [Marinifilum caeruleilacunae]NOU60743.1 SRPBCC family protein [Marinifilum caeruleilacunae]